MNPAPGDARPVLIVGATGRIGSEVIRLLLAQGISVRALVRPGSPLTLPGAAGVEVVSGELGGRASLDSAVRGVAACVVAVRDHPDQAQWESALIDTLETHAPVPLVKVSAFAASLSPPPGYGRAHAEVEEKLRRSTLPWTVLQPYMYMQNLLDMATPVRKLGCLPLPLGRCRVAFIDARDVARAAAGVLVAGEHAGQTHVLTGGQALSGADLATALSEVLDRRVRYLAVPQALASLLMRADGVSRWDVAMRAELFAMLRENGESRTSDACTRLTGTAPTSVHAFLRDHRPVFSDGLY